MIVSIGTLKEKQSLGKLKKPENLRKSYSTTKYVYLNKN